MALQTLHQLMFMVSVPSEKVQQIVNVITQHKIKLQHITTLPYSDGDASQVLVMFSCPRGEQVAISKDLDDALGAAVDINIIPLALAKDTKPKKDASAALEQDDEGAMAPLKRENVADTFTSTIKARIAVENMLEIVYEGASFSFDFFMLSVVASSLALTGLLTNSSVTLVASMLVSPMMGPILGITFGSVVRDRQLIKTGLISSFFCLIICISVGYIGGLAAAPAAMRQYPWPTSESLSRGDRSSLYVGAAIAIPSGVGVALSIMGQNTNSLVGVAIRLLWAQATLTDYYVEPTCLSNGNNMTVWDDCCFKLTPGPRCPTNTDYQSFCCTNAYYSASDYGNMGAISLALTLVNVLCIWVFGAITFMFKEVAPLPNKNELWASLVPKTRQFNVDMANGKIQEEEIKRVLQQRSEGRAMAKGAKLTRDYPIGKGALQARRIGATGNGVVLPTSGGRNRSSGNLLTRLHALFPEFLGDNDDNDDEDEKAVIEV